MNELSAVKPHSSPSFVLGPSPKILFVHNQSAPHLQQVQETVSALFQQPKFDVVLDIPRALEIAAKERYDLIIFEGNLENTEAEEMAFQAFRTKQVAAPVVGFCSIASAEIERKWRKAGMVDVIMPGKLETFLRQHIGEVNSIVPRQLILDEEPRIMIIDDLPNDFKIIVSTSIIMNIFPNAKLVIVETGAEALKQLETNMYDVVFVDFNLGTRIVGGKKEFVYGDMVAKDLRNAGVTTYLVGFSTNMEKVEDRQKCLDAGMDDAIVPNELCQYLKSKRSTVNVG